MFRLSRKNLFPSIILLVVLGAVVLWWVVQSSDKNMRSELLQQARIAAQAIPLDLLASISGSEKDLGTVAYQRIKTQLALMRKAKTNCRFLYLMGRRMDGTVFFFVDSLPSDSEDYAPPGLVYDEVPESYITAFETKGESVVGPVTDRWGTLVTALIPIESPDAHNLLAVLGMDVDATDWNQEILGHCIGPLLVILLLIMLFFLMVSREKILIELKNSEARLRNIVENSTNMFYSHTVGHVLTYISPQSRDFLQCEPEEAMIRWTEFLTDNPINQIGVELTQRAIDTGTSPKPYELELIGKRGKIILVEVNETTVLENGKTIGVVGSLTNITDRKQAEETLLRERDNLKQALEEIKTLQGILPICTHCKKIRDGSGYWNQIEAYIRDHSEVTFSHSVCEECAKKFYSDLNLEED